MLPAESRPTREDVIFSWWSTLEQNRGDRAELRRCATPAEVAFTPAYHQLLHRLNRAGHHGHPEDIAVLAAVLAHVKTHDRNSRFAEQLAADAGGKARMSGLRFRRLLAVERGPEFQAALIRAIRLLDGRANVMDLIRAALFWNDTTRKQWARDYYAAAPSTEP